jgi:hypothetical protein
MLKRRFFRTCLASVAITFLTAAAAPPPGPVPPVERSMAATSGVPGSCDLCADISEVGGYVHGFQGGGALFDCIHLNSCHTNLQSGICGGSHCPCSAFQCWSHDDVLDVSTDVTTDGTVKAAAVGKAAGEGQTEKLLLLVSQHSDQVKLNVERRVVQVVGCGARVVAQFPIADGVIQALLQSAN